MTKDVSDNPLMRPFDTPHQTVPFGKIKPEHFEPAISAEIEKTRERVQAIIDNPQPPDFDNTVAALDYADLRLKRLQSILSNLNSAETNPELQAAAEKIMPRISDFYSELMQNRDLFQRVKAVYDRRDSLDLTDEQRMLLDQTYRAFVRSGVDLPPDKRERLREINAALTRAGLKFTKNLLHDTNAYYLHLTDEKDLEGLPEDVRQAAAAEARKRNLEGWVFTLHYPSYGPFMKYAANRALREKLYKMYGSRAFHGDEYNNTGVVLDEVNLRKEKAALLGYPSYAAFVLEERMAEKPDTVWQFLDQLRQYAMPHARRDVERLRELARADGIDTLQAWDVAYYSEKLKRAELDLDDEKLKPYFPLDRVLDGMFEVARKLYGIRFEPAPDIDVYHPEVQAYRVLDRDGSFLGVFYTDFYPRPGKRQGAWMTSYRPQYKKDGRNVRPHISIVSNFTRPAGDKPSLLSFYEVNTLFHEFGHALHGLLSQVTYPSLSGTHVYWDFVELPSQIMENWTYEPEVLRMFARHYATDEPLPEETVQKLKDEKKFLEGMATVRQLGFGYLDMYWHDKYPEDFRDIVQYENAALDKVRLYPYVEGTLISPSFGHLFSGGYAAGYYSYKWAELLDADAFSIFKKSGIFDPETARKFRHLLEQGGSKHPMKLYLEFAGRPPRMDALLERAGFKQSDSN
ncbi:MAG: M3 family metallopeptidase [Chlorobi bacterium]|nr:M3 family metallopeptidase [Chlorobiota bacterium]